MKKLLITILLFSLSGCSSNVDLGANKDGDLIDKNKVKEESLKLKFDKKSDFLGKIVNNGVVDYAYNSGKLVDDDNYDRVIDVKKPNKLLGGTSTELFATTTIVIDLANEIINERDKRTRVFDIGDNQTAREIIPGVPQYYKDQDGIWWLANYGTTTEDAFIAQLPDATSTAWWDGFLVEVAQATESTFFSGSGDGTIIKDNVTTWAAARDAVSGTVQTANPNYAMAEQLAGPRFRCARIFFGSLDTSSIPDSDTIDSAVMKVYGFAAAGNDYSDDVHLVPMDMADPTTLATGDFDSVTFSSEDSIAISSISSATYNDFSVSTLALISKTSYTELGLILGKDLNDSSPTTQGDRNYQYFYNSSESGTSKDPKLVVVHSAGGAVVERRVAPMFEFK